MAIPFPTQDPDPTNPEPLIDAPLELTEDGEYLVGTPDPDAEEEYETSGLREWDENLADKLPAETLSTIALQVRDKYDTDKASRDKWYELYKRGLESMVGEDDDEASSTRSNRQLTDVSHPLIVEASTQFQARAINELFPAAGPVGSIVLGETTRPLQEQANRIGKFMNYQLTEQMPEYFPDMDQMLSHLPQVGQTFKKSWYDPRLRRLTSRFVRAEDFVVDDGAADLDTAEQYVHVLRLNRNVFDGYVRADYYLPVNVEMTVTDPSTDKEIEGVVQTNAMNGTQVELLEAHCYISTPEHPEEERPYVVTLEESTDTVLAVRRNWDPDDDTFQKQVWFVPYKFLPGPGFYGFGLYHVIGGLGRAATGALRSLLDAAAYANMQGGFKLKGRVRGGEVGIQPGEFADIDAAVDDIQKAIMPLPFKEPSQTMMMLLQFVVETGKRFANTADMNISDANQNTPVGTTVALLEENGRVFSAIHKRLHNSQRLEFKIIAKLNGIYLPPKYPFKVKGESQYVLREDFDDRVDVVPISDPSTFSSTQRIAQAQAMLQMAQAAPQFHNLHTALRRMYEALRIPNWEEVLIDPSKTSRMDAVAENVAIMHNRPIRAYEDQDHNAHMMVLDDWFNRLPQQAQQLYMQSYASHRAEHMALLYRAQLQAQMAAAMPGLPNYHDPSEMNKDIDPELDRKISQAAAVIVNSKPQQPMGPEPGAPKNAQGAANDPMAAAKMLAEAEAMSIQAKAQADIQAKQAKARSDLQIAQAKAQFEMQQRQLEAQLEMRLQQIRLQAENEQAKMEKALEAETDREKAQADIRLMWQKAQMEMQIAREKSAEQLNQKRMELAAKLQMEREKNQMDMVMEERRTEHQMELDLQQSRNDNKKKSDE